MDRQTKRKIMLEIACLYIRALDIQVDCLRGKIRRITKDKQPWREPEHPRKDNGQFTSGGGSCSKTTKNKYKKTAKHGKIKLSKAEYARVVSAINTDLPKEQREWDVCVKDVGNYRYKFRNNGFGEYDFLQKQRIH